MSDRYERIKVGNQEMIVVPIAMDHMFSSCIWLWPGSGPIHMIYNLGQPVEEGDQDDLSIPQ